MILVKSGMRYRRSATASGQVVFSAGFRERQNLSKIDDYQQGCSCASLGEDGSIDMQGQIATIPSR